MKEKINNKNIVFWGGKAACGTTSNLAALASYMAYFHGYRMRLCQTDGTTLRTYFTESALEVTQRKGMFLRNTGSIDEQRKMTFIDCGRRTDEWTRQIMKKADLVVINLPQTVEAFDTFFLQHVRFSAKSVYLVSYYQKGAFYNQQKLQWLYRIPTEQIAVVPFNPEFQLACERGHLDHYMCKEAPFYVSEIRRYFLRELDCAMNRMIQQL